MENSLEPKRYAILSRDTLGLLAYLKRHTELDAVLHPASEVFVIANLTNDELLYLSLLFPITYAVEIQS